MWHDILQTRYLRLKALAILVIMCGVLFATRGSVGGTFSFPLSMSDLHIQAFGALVHARFVLFSRSQELIQSIRDSEQQRPLLLRHAGIQRCRLNL